MGTDEIKKLAALGDQSEEQLAFAHSVGRADLTLTALAVAIHVLSQVPDDRSKGNTGAMRLLFHEMAGDDGDIWMERAIYLVDGTIPEGEGEPLPPLE